MARIRKGNATTMEKQNTGNAWLVALYIRLSREDGNDESESVINQKKILNAFLEKEFDEPYEIVDYYIDDGISGTDDSRADFMRMIARIEDKEINCVIVKALSRAFRNYSNQGFYLETYFPQKKVRFISLGDPKVDTYKNPDVIHGLELPIAGVLNDRYAAMTSSAIRRTFKMKRENGEFIGAFPPYGFLKDPADKNRLIIDPETLPIKMDMKNWIIVEGMSLSGVAGRLNSLGIPNPAAYKRSKGWKYRSPQTMKNAGHWNPKTVREILLSPANIGHMVQGKQRIVSYKVHDREAVPSDQWYVAKNVIEPTFSVEDYEKLLALLKRDTRAASGSGIVHLFAGFVRCADCDRAMHRKKTGRFVYYYCRSYKEKKMCSSHTIREDDLYKAVLASMQAHFALLQSLAEIVAQIGESPVINTLSDRIMKMCADKRAEIEKLKMLSDGLYVDWKSGTIDTESHQRMRRNFDERLEQLKASLLNLEEEQRRLTQCSDCENEAFQEFVKRQNLAALDRAVLGEMIDTIYVHEGKAITILYKLADEVQRIAESFDTDALATTNR